MFALCDLGASVFTIPKSLCDVLGLTDIEECSLNLHSEDSTIKKPLGRINWRKYALEAIIKLLFIFPYIMINVYYSC